MIERFMRMSRNCLSRLWSRHVPGRRLQLLLLAAVWACWTLPCAGQTNGGDLEARVKAAYIYNFTKFVYWGEGMSGAPSSPITIFVLGSDAVGDLLGKFARTQTSGQPILVKKISTASDHLSSCRLLFVSRSAEKQLPEIFRQLRGTDVLTVSDISGFTRQGGMIGFVIEDARVKIQINLQAATTAGLKISAKLLEIARIVSSED